MCVFEDIRTAPALDIVALTGKTAPKDPDNNSGFQKSYHTGDCQAALAATRQYQCGANLFVAALNSSPTKGASHHVL
jgi:hypothetical protein